MISEKIDIHLGSDSPTRPTPAPTTTASAKHRERTQGKNTGKGQATQSPYGQATQSPYDAEFEPFDRLALRALRTIESAGRGYRIQAELTAFRWVID
jgi:hypothetical protein